jgi:hypothetical protein
MPVWGWILIAIAVVAVIAVLAALSLARRRSAGLRRRFGPEYDHTVDAADSRRAAEAELSARERRRAELDIRPLDAAARERYADSWQRVQSDFVDSPAAAVSQADVLVLEVMRERGYPMDDFEQRAADVSVDHPTVVESYREGHRLSQLSASGDATTEDLRQAMQHYRRLFEELLDSAADEPTRRERVETADGAGARSRAAEQPTRR